MGTTKASKRPKLRWDQHKREVLCCLHRFFVRDKKQFEEIFSYLFRDHLQNRGIQGFVPFSTLNTQWCFMRNERDPVWCHVHIDTSFETGAEWKEIIETIKSAADILQLPLREVENEIDTTRERSLGADSGKSPVPVS